MAEGVMPRVRDRCWRWLWLTRPVSANMASGGYGTCAVYDVAQTDVSIWYTLGG